ncbi:MAG: pentapeptide repeat-containing protein [bacterium]
MEAATLLEFLFDTHLAETLTVLGGVFATATAGVKTLRTRQERRRLEPATLEKVADARRWYVAPRLSTGDRTSPNFSPDQATSWRALPYLSRFLRINSVERRVVVLAGPGMGKSALLLNILALVSRQLLNRTECVLLELRHPNALERVRQVRHPESTVLLLDGLDESPVARKDVGTFVRELNELTVPFYRVILTGRTQFFNEAAALFAELFSPIGGSAPAGPISSGTYVIRYLEPLDESEVQAVLRKRFSHNSARLARARAMVAKVRDIAARPMLLAYLEFLLDREDASLLATVHRTARSSPPRAAESDAGALGHSVRWRLRPYQIYEQMIQGWLERRKGDLDPDPSAALSFLRQLALHMVTRPGGLGSFQLTRSEVQDHARTFGEDVDTWKLTGRSLLVYDQSDVYRFVHLSFLEVLVARAIVSGVSEPGRSDSDSVPNPAGSDRGSVAKRSVLRRAPPDEALTDPIRTYLREMILEERLIPGEDLTRYAPEGQDIALRGEDLSSRDLSGSILKRSDLREADLRDTNFDTADLSQANLEFQSLTARVFRGTQFAGAQFKGADCSFARFEGCDLRDAVFTGADLSGSRFIDCMADGVRLFGARLDGARIERGSFRSADLRRTRRTVGGQSVSVELCSFEGAALPSDWETFIDGIDPGERHEVDHEASDIEPATQSHVSASEEEGPPRSDEDRRGKQS